MTSKVAASRMEQKTLLSVLSPQLQTLVEASLGEQLQIRKVPAAPSSDAVTGAPSPADTNHGNREHLKPSIAPSAGSTTASAAQSVKLNPSELFVLSHPESPGYVVKENFLGRDDAIRARHALLKFTETADFHQAAVGFGGNKREEMAVRGDRIHWIQRPKDLKNSTALDPAILLLMRKVESTVFGIKNGLPQLDLRNVTSTQLAVFPGDGARFVKHTDTYATAHLKGRSDSATGDTSLARLITCVFYLNPEWVSDHGGCLRVFTKGLPQQFWDVPPVLDTLVVFRSTDVEHEVLPTFHDRMALTIWYYGPAPKTSSTFKSSLSHEPAPVLPPAPSFSPSPFKCDPPHASSSIFVAIPSYRDSECVHTVDDLLAKARDASRVTIGICLQCDDQDDTKAYLEAKYSTRQVRVTRIHYRDAAGPCVARAIAQDLYDDEAFYLQIDSHMRVRRGWDDFLIHELSRCASAKPILTTYPLGYTLPNELSEEERPTLLCASTFDDQGMLRQSSKVLSRKADAPIPSLFWAAGFAFCSGRVVKDVPYDVSLRFLFFGEEASMSSRLWTQGWDFFAPSEMPIYHLWTRAYRPVFQELESGETKSQRQQSLQTVLRQLRDVSGEVLERSLAEYQSHIGVDFAARTIEWRAEWGGLNPIQFDLSVMKDSI